MSKVTKLNAFGKIALVRDTELDIPSRLKHILLTISTYLGKNDFAYIGIRELMKRCEMKSRKQFDKYINRLIELKLLKKIPPSDGYRSNRYLINLDLIKVIHKMTVPPYRGRPPQRGTQRPPFWLQCPPLEGDLYIDKLKNIKLRDAENKKSPSEIQQAEMNKIKKLLATFH